MTDTATPDPKAWVTRVLEVLQAKSKHTPGEVHTLYLVVCAALGKRLNRPMSFGETARMDRNYKIRTNYTDRTGTVNLNVEICTAGELSRSLTELAREAELSDGEATALFTTVRMWIAVDEIALAQDNLGG